MSDTTSTSLLSWSRRKSRLHAFFAGACVSLSTLALTPHASQAQTAPTALQGTAPSVGQAIADNGGIAGTINVTTNGPGAYWSSSTATPVAIPQTGTGKGALKFVASVGITSSYIVGRGFKAGATQPGATPGLLYTISTNSYTILPTLTKDEYNANFGYLGQSQSIIFPTGIANNGTTVGYANNALVDRAWVLPFNATTSIALPGLIMMTNTDDNSYARSITSKNDGDEWIVGDTAYNHNADQQAVLWKYDTTTSKYVAVNLSGGAGSRASAISPNGLYIAGFAGSNAVYWKRNTTTGAWAGPLTLSAGSSSVGYSVTGVNNNGVVIGSQGTSGGSSVPYAWRISAGGTVTVIDLNQSLPANSGWVLTAVNGIDNSTSPKIVGSGTFGGQTRAYLWTVP